MVKTVKYPTKNSILYFDDNTVYLRSDMDTINQYCLENNYTYVSHEAEEQRFSNDGALAYAYYGPFKYIDSDGDEVVEIKWQTEFGFKRIVTLLTVEH